MNFAHGLQIRKLSRRSNPMNFDLDEAIAVLSRTPATLRALLGGLPGEWTRSNEGAETWSPFDVVGHLIHGERTDWIPRVKIILDRGEARPFDPFDRFAQFEQSTGGPLEELLNEFADLREQNIATLCALDLDKNQLGKTGLHPALGRVSLKELLATWVTHDLDHLGQVARTMAKQYAAEVGPWKAYISILAERCKTEAPAADSIARHSLAGHSTGERGE
jgi:hypothetical protein